MRIPLRGPCLCLAAPGHPRPHIPLKHLSTGILTLMGRSRGGVRSSCHTLGVWNEDTQGVASVPSLRRMVFTPSQSASHPPTLWESRLGASTLRLPPGPRGDKGSQGFRPQQLLLTCRPACLEPTCPALGHPHRPSNSWLGRQTSHLFSPSPSSYLWPLVPPTSSPGPLPPGKEVFPPPSPPGRLWKHRGLRKESHQGVAFASEKSGANCSNLSPATCS